MVNRQAADHGATSETPLVSVLMSVRDVPVAMFRQAVDSVLAQTCGDFECLIYDDGCADRTLVDVMKHYAQRDARIRLRHGPPRGLTATLNIGLAEARGRYIARHDADDWSEPDRLARQVKFLERRADVVVCGSNAGMRQETGAPLWITRLPLELDAVNDALWNGNPFVHGAAMFRAEAARSIGGYREDFTCSQDYDFFWRLCDYGGGANLPAPLYHYRFRKTAVSAQRAEEQASVHNVTQMLARARRTGEEIDVGAALAAERSAFRLSCRARLKQADHRMLAGDYAGAIRSYASLLSRHPANLPAWGKLIRWFVFVTAPPLRPLCFRMSSSQSHTSDPNGAALRIMFVIPGAAAGSSMIFARRQADALRSQSVDVRVFYLRSRTSPRVLLSEWLRFRKELRATRPHVVHAHFGTVTALFTAITAHGIPLVITYRGSDLNPVSGTLIERLRARTGHIFSQVAALAAAQIVCVSEQLVRRLLWRHDRAVVLPSGVDPDAFRPESRDAARRRLGWKQEDTVILFNSGNGAAVKRRDLAEAAIACAQCTRPSLRMEVMDGYYSPELVPTLMNAADCLLVTSDHEGSPTVVQEALASNLPIVSVDVGDVAQRLCGVRATRIALRDPEALASALDEVLSLGVRSDGRMKSEECSSHRVASELQAIYATLASTMTAPRFAPKRIVYQTSQGNR